MSSVTHHGRQRKVGVGSQGLIHRQTHHTIAAGFRKRVQLTDQRKTTGPYYRARTGEEASYQPSSSKKRSEQDMFQFNVHFRVKRPGIGPLEFITCTSCSVFVVTRSPIGTSYGTCRSDARATHRIG